MDKQELEDKLKRVNEIKFTEHALFKMKSRQITKSMISDFIHDKRPLDYIIERDPRGKKFTVEYRISNSRDLYITLKFKEESIYIITAIVSSKKVVANIRKRLGKWKKRRM